MQKQQQQQQQLLQGAPGDCSRCKKTATGAGEQPEIIKRNTIGPKGKKGSRPVGPRTLEQARPRHAHVFMWIGRRKLEIAPRVHTYVYTEPTSSELVTSHVEAEI